MYFWPVDTDHHIEFRDVTLDQVARVAHEIVGIISRPVLLIEGEMGAGKTTLIKALCNELEVEDPVSSPTFSLVNEYRTHSNSTVYHFDLYRLNSPEEALDFGVEEYFESGDICLVEWPGVLEGHFPDRVGFIKIDVEPSGRKILFYPDTVPYL